jgi:hypothetical protein
MAKSLFLSLIFTYLIGVAISFAQPKGVLAPKARDIEEAPEDSVAAAVYIGMSYEELMTVFDGLKNFSESESLTSLQKKEKELRTIRDMAWRLVQFMEDPIKQRVAESSAREAHRVKLLKEVNALQEQQADFTAERESRIKILDSLTKKNESDSLDVQTEEESDADGDGWADEPPAEKENVKTKKKENKKPEKQRVIKEEKRKTYREQDKKPTAQDKQRAKAEEKQKEMEKQRALEKQKEEEKRLAVEKQKEAQKEKLKAQQEKLEREKQKQAEKEKQKQEKEQAKFVEKEQAMLEASYEDSTKMMENLQLMEDSIGRYTTDLKAFEDSTELLRKQLKPVKGLAFEIRKAWVKMNHAVMDKTENLGKEADAEFQALIDDFHNIKFESVLKTLSDPSFIERIKSFRDHIFYSKRIPNIDCKGGIGNFMKGLSPEEAEGMDRHAGCVGFVLGLGDDCNLVILKLIDESKIAIVCRKDKDEEMGAIKLIK